MTECNQSQFEFEAHFSRRVMAEFSGERLTTEGGALLLRAADRKIGLLRRVVRCFSDARDPQRIAHELSEMLAQRIYGLALGYEDQLLVLTRAPLREAPCELRRRDVVDGSHVNNGSVAPVFANTRCEPLKTFFIHGIPRKKVTGVPERHCSVALQLSPDFHPFTCSLCRQGEGQQKPRS